MTAKKCDRCGDFYEMDYRRSIVTIDTPNNPNRQFDLCPDCTKDFETWIKNEGYVFVMRELK